MRQTEYIVILVLALTGCPKPRAATPGAAPANPADVTASGPLQPGMTQEAARAFGPPSPTGLQASVSGSGVRLTFNPSPLSTVREHRLYRMEGRDPASLRLVARLPATAAKSIRFTDSKVSSGHEFQYFVTAVDEFGKESDQSNIVSVRVP